MRAVHAAAFAAALLAGGAWADEAGPTDLRAAAEPESTVVGRGLASWYGRNFHGKRTASGERFDMNDFTAAHRTLPFGTVVEVHSLVNGRSIEVRVNDRGPFLRKRVIDLSRAAAEALGLVQGGVGVKQVVLKVRPQPMQPE